MLKRCLNLTAQALLAVVMAVLCTTSAFAQLNTAKIEGVVRDRDSGQPLAGVQVTVEGTRLGNVTNEDGYFFILNVSPGRQNIVFSFTGFQKTTVSDQLLLAGQTATVNANLSSTIVELEGITVAAEADPLVPRDNTVTKQRLTADAISETPATRIEDLMTMEAGVQTGGTGGLGRGLRIRGGRVGEEAMVVDGITVRNYTADPFRSGQGWVYEQEDASQGEDSTPLDVSTSSVEQVDIITGGFQAEYGNAQSGIVNIVTKEGSADYEGTLRYTTDAINPRTADYGYNQLQASIGGPVPGVPNLFFHGSGEIQGQADRDPTHASEGFRGINQDFVDRLNQAVRNDPVLGMQQPAFTMGMFQTGREFYAGKTGASSSLFTPPNPTRVPGNWGDRHLVNGKLAYYPMQGLKLIGTTSFSRPQNSYPVRDNGNYFYTGIVTPNDIPAISSAFNRDWSQDSDSVLYIPQALGRRTRTANNLVGVDWDFIKSADRSATLQFRFSDFRTTDVNSSQLADDYDHSDTFMGWDPSDAPFEIETFPGRNYPMEGTADAARYFPNGRSGWERNWAFETPFRVITGEWLYWLAYRYLREEQQNYKADVDFQLDRHNRAKFGFQFTDFDNNMFNIAGGSSRRDLANEFAYAPRMYAGYVQNRTDLGDLVLDYGIRYDRFEPSDNWGLRNGDQWGDRFEPTDLSEISPRFDVAFPVTDRSQLRFAYGVFTQLPSMTYIFSGSNPGELGYSRTDAFEAGISYMLSTDLMVDAVAYYRDVDGNVANKRFFRDYYAEHMDRRFRDYQTGLTNRDNGNIKGLDLTLRRRFANNFAFNAMYTMQFSRTTGSAYNSTDNWDIFMDPTTGEEFTPPDELRPINGDQTHKLTLNLNYAFPEDYRDGTMAGTILENLRMYAIWQLGSGWPAVDRVVPGGSTYHLNAAENTTWMTRRGGRPIGGINYFRGRWNYELDLRVTKNFNFGGNKRFGVFTEVFNALNNKLPTPYPSGYNYDGYYWVPNGGNELVWDDAFLGDTENAWINRVWFNSDFNADGVLSLEEQAKGMIAYDMMVATMEKSAYGWARQIRTGVEFSF